ncbi:7704_t:CDS:2 [Racocetra fulgida]|uniref:7704_t:CDS:1 n=1 Tax=Racocetra fulgida TaxID=60492 RepID=A0A9N9E1N3_9GLOM|nr:7704_t:CDS:2 [Racocetra fulgida]
MNNQIYDLTSPNNSETTFSRDNIDTSDEEFSDQLESSTQDRKRKHAEGKKIDEVWDDVIKDDTFT